MIHAAILAATTQLSPPPDPWAARIRAMRYVSSSGDSVALVPAIESLREVKVDNPAIVRTKATFDRHTGLVDVCYLPVANVDTDPNPATCDFDVVVRSADTGVVGGTREGTVNDETIGLTLQQLLDRLHADPILKSKSLTKGPHGDVVRIDTTETDDLHCQSGQCEALAPTTITYYFLADGIVVARAYHIHHI